MCIYIGDARGVMVTVIGNGQNEQSSNLDESVCSSHSANTLVKGMNPTTLSLSLSLSLSQLSVYQPV